jgi:hypothetical protein
VRMRKPRWLQRRDKRSWRNCRSKRRYRSEHTANRVIKRMVREGRAVAKTLHSYECTQCSCFHVGHGGRRLLEVNLGIGAILT